MNFTEAQLFLYGLELIYNHDVQRSVVFENNGSLISGVFYQDHGFVNDDQNVKFRTAFMDEFLAKNNFEMKDKQNRFKRHLPDSFTKLQKFVHSLNPIQNSGSVSAIYDIKFLSSGVTLPFYILTDDSCFRAISFIEDEKLAHNQ